MTNIKKIVALLLCVVMTLGFTACRTENESAVVYKTESGREIPVRSALYILFQIDADADYKEEYDAKLEKIHAQRERMLEEARQEAFRITRQAKEETEYVIKELRKLEQENASKEKSRKIEELRKNLSTKEKQKIRRISL